MRWTSLFFHHWQAKLASLVLATILWLVIRQAVGDPPPAPHPATAPTPEAVPRE